MVLSLGVRYILQRITRQMLGASWGEPECVFEVKKTYWHLYGINSVKQLLYNNDVVYRCSKSHQLIIAQCNIHRHPWSSSSDMLFHSHSSDRYV